ncbi:malate dehydrogenase, mitochondrial-like [Coccinella septempunctata]|uniref:malate dehydrogenase, mitochondrial-like n=1 Tax=Coccinella septempunctata TaxID=41139 RepID=UPI001D0631D5|nr:malate dehydrogenase, mitochondrial-like [Coccinella septempunctata]
MFPRFILRRYSSALTKSKELKKKLCKEPVENSFCNVALIGADSKLGELTAFLVKQNPLITTLHLQGGAGVVGLCEDLAHIDTRCRVVAHAGLDNYRNAMKTADVVVLLGLGGFSSRTTIGDRVMAEGNRICKLAEKCTKYARRAIIVVCSTPVSVMTPLVVDMFKRTDWYHPSRIVGFPGPVSVVLNTEVARHQCFDPSIVDVPIIGGPDLESIVPVFSKAVPCPVDRRSAVELTARLRGLDPSDFPRRSRTENTFVTAVYPEAIALNRLISTIAYGIHGDEVAVSYAHVRTNWIKTCRFLVSQVRFGKTGVVHNYGIPKLSKFEQDLLERGVAAVSDREHMAKEYLDYYLSKRRDILPCFKQREIEEYHQKRESMMRN